MNISLINYRPPKIAQLFIGIAAILHWVTPMHRLLIYSNRIAGTMIGILGFLIMMWAWWLFKKADTAICPTAENDSLVITGIFLYSRNPMYLGIIAMLLGVAIFCGTFPFYAATAVYFVIMNNVFCPYEENKLSESFGDAYLSYKNNVRRWL